MFPERSRPIILFLGKSQFWWARHAFSVGIYLLLLEGLLFIRTAILREFWREAKARCAYRATKTIDVGRCSEPSSFAPSSSDPIGLYSYFVEGTPSRGWRKVHGILPIEENRRAWIGTEEVL